jgi:hypothetical protein
VPSGSVPLLLELVGDRERDPVLLDVGVEDLVVEQRGRVRLEEDAGSLALRSPHRPRRAAKRH